MAKPEPGSERHRWYLTEAWDTIRKGKIRSTSGFAFAVGSDAGAMPFLAIERRGAEAAKLARNKKSVQNEIGDDFRIMPDSIFSGAVRVHEESKTVVFLVEDEGEAAKLAKFVQKAAKRLAKNAGSDTQLRKLATFLRKKVFVTHDMSALDTDTIEKGIKAAVQGDGEDPDIEWLEITDDELKVFFAKHAKEVKKLNKEADALLAILDDATPQTSDLAELLDGWETDKIEDVTAHLIEKLSPQAITNSGTTSVPNMISLDQIITQVATQVKLFAANHREVEKQRKKLSELQKEVARDISNFEKACQKAEAEAEAEQDEDKRSEKFEALKKKVEDWEDEEAVYRSRYADLRATIATLQLQNERVLRGINNLIESVKAEG